MIDLHQCIARNSETCNQHGYGTQTTVSNNLNDLMHEVYKTIATNG